MNDTTPTTAEEQEEAMIYVGREPNVDALQEAYHETIRDLDEFFDSCTQAYEERRNIWPGKSADMRKHGPNAFPWEGASDTEVNVTGERIDAYVSILMQALERSHIKAFPQSAQAMPKAATVSAFLKWMRKSYIPDFRKHMELGANYLLEKGLMVTYVGWQKERRTYKQLVTLQQVAEQMPEVAELIVNGDNDEEVAELIKQISPTIKKSRAKRCIRELRQAGVTEIPMARESVDRPCIHSCSPDGDVFFPPYTSDPQKAPYCFYRDFLTPQELEKKVTNEGWDASWVEHAINNLRGKDTMYLDGEKMNRVDRIPFVDDNRLIMIVRGYQRLIDDDGSEGIYETVFHPDCAGYAKHELMNGYDDYPFIVTALNNNQKRMYEVRNFSDFLRGPQYTVKTERDSRTDRASMATLPPLMHPAGRPPSDYGPGARIPYRRLGELAFGPQPPNDSGSREIEELAIQQADKAVGLDVENPLAMVRQQFFVDKFLEHAKDVLSMAYKLFQRMGPDELFFQVTGNPDPQVMEKGDVDEHFDIAVSFDTKETDPENVKNQLASVTSMLAYDANGRIDVDKLIELAMATINPFYADYILKPVQESQQEVMKNITDDLAKIFAGIEVPSRPNGAQSALQIIQGYVQQPDVAGRLQQDEAFAARLEKYMQGYQFQIQQVQNAEIGRIGVQPAEMGGVRTQDMAQE